MAIGGLGRQFARNADEIAELLKGLRSRLTNPEWTGPGIEFTRPVPSPIQPPARPYRAPEYSSRGRTPLEEPGPRTVQFPREDVRPTGETFTSYTPEEIVPIRPEFLDFFDESFDADPVRAQFELANFLENLSTPNELYRASVLMQRIRPRMNRQMSRGLDRALEEAALRVGVPPTQRMGPMYLFQYVSPEGAPPVRERVFDTMVDLRKRLRNAAGGSVDKAKKGGFVRLSALEEWDSGPNGGIIGTARAEGAIDETAELQLRQQLDYWRGQIYEGMGIDPASMRGIQSLKLSDDMPEQERFMRLAQAMRTADSRDELASIFAEVDEFIVSSSYRDMLEDIVDAQVRRLALAGEETGESLGVLRRRVYGQSDDLERGGLETFTPEEEFVTRRLPEGVSLYGAPPEDAAVVLARVNERLRRLGVEPIPRSAIGTPRPRRLGSAARDPQEMYGGERLPMPVENWEWYRAKAREEGKIVPRTPEWGYRSGGWILPKQSGMGSAVAPQRGRSVELSQQEIDEEVLNMLIEEGAVGRTGAAVRAVPDEVIESGTEAQRAWARRYGQSRVDQLMSSDAQTRREAALATRAARDEGLLSDEMLGELREAAGFTRRAPAAQPAAPNVPRETPAVSANAPNVNTPPPAPSVAAGAGNIVPVNPNNSGMVSYIPRTIENAQSSDITIAVATDFTTSGEKLTKNAALGRVRAELRDEPSRYNPEQTIKIWRRVDGTRNGEFGEIRPIVQIRHGAENLDEYVDQIVETLNGIAAQTGRPVTINGAGNGIARLRSQAEADVYARHIMARIVNHPDRNFEIGLVRSGGQNGYDVAFNKAAKVYGIRTEINPAYSSNGMVNVQTKSGESERISVAQYVRRYQLGTGDIGEIS